MGSIICVGAVYIDTILTVPRFPGEDEKLRARELTRRRGGNCPNSLEVLEQLIDHDNSGREQGDGADFKENSRELHLLSVLPDEKSDDVKFIKESLSYTNLSPCSIYRPENQHAASSYVIMNEEKGSRTIVNYNALKEMTADEFHERLNVLGKEKIANGWCHFEGRTPDITLQCVKDLRTSQDWRSMRVSIELEKPDRTGLIEVAALADAVFYSRIWAEGRGFDNPRDFLQSQVNGTRPGAVLICTWGARGVVAVQKGTTEEQAYTWESVSAWHPAKDGSSEDVPVIDPVGAGDTFVAGMLFALVYHEEWSLRRKLEFSNELAGRKVFQNGFNGLGLRLRPKLYDP